MANITITSNDFDCPVLEGAVFRDELLTFTGAGTVVAGTILARDSVSLKMVPYVKGGATNENGIIKALVTYDVVAAGAGDVAIRSCISGKMRLEKLVIDADGDGTNIDAAVIDELIARTLVPVSVTELNIADNS